MKTNRIDPLAACFTLSHLREAARKCAQGVSWKGQVQRFMADELCQCVRLQDEVLTGTWRPEEVRPFTLSERGKIRRVMPVAVRDRVVQRCLCDNVLVPFVEGEVIDGCNACLPGRGLERAIGHVRKILEELPPGAWYMLFDFHDYFHAIQHEPLLARLRAKLPKEFCDIIALSIGGEGGVGLELGSEVCQVLAVWNPTPLDHLVLTLPGCRGYERYMDDGFAGYETREEAIEGLRAFEQSATAMGLEMNERKTLCNRATAPFVFCKRRFTKRASGVRVNVRKEQTHHLVRHDRHVNARAREAGIDTAPVKAASIGYFDSGDAYLSPRLMQSVGWD